MENWSDVGIAELLVASLKSYDEIGAITGLNWMEPNDIGVLIIHAKDVVATFAGCKRKASREIGADSYFQNVVVDADDTTGYMMPCF